jgi:hypothetical protein
VMVFVNVRSNGTTDTGVVVTQSVTVAVTS